MAIELNSNQQKIYDAIWDEPITRKLKFSKVDGLLSSICENRISRKGSPNVALRIMVRAGECTVLILIKVLKRHISNKYKYF